MDPENPTCPKAPSWSNNPAMIFATLEVNGEYVLMGEGAIDADMAKHLAKALKSKRPIDEIWLRSPGGNALVGNEAGKLIRAAGIPTRIPAGWACFSACNFVFMGGPVRSVDPGGVFMVHMFTHVSNHEQLDSAMDKGTDQTAALIGDIEQDSAMLASDDNDFLIRMGVSRKLLTEVMYQQKAIKLPGKRGQSTRRCLSQIELRRYNVTNAG
jgi:hypothetical protein